MNDSEDIVRLESVEKTFRDFWLRPTVKAVDGLSLSVRKGEVFGLLGPNGSGKSTTIKMILGLLSPSAGDVRLFGLPPRAIEARRKLGYLPELSYLHPFLTAKETLRYYAGLCGLKSAEAKERTTQLLEMVGLADVAGRPVGGFSKGMARRVSLASALVGRPELLVLDEPTSGLDPVSTKEVKTLVKALAANGMTVLTTSHLLADAEDICDRVMILDHGKSVAEGRVSELGTSLEDFFLAKVGDASEFRLAPFLG
ncbi:MAG: ABC transporter ATP-binding protein [Kiritimatiellae bacterium]|nr:ABC transporter ATP-binding protein [Kiritimatiellia bacterium]